MECFRLQATEIWLRGNSQCQFTPQGWGGYRAGQSGSPAMHQGPQFFPLVPVGSLSTVATPLVVAKLQQLLPASPHVPIQKSFPGPGTEMPLTGSKRLKHPGYRVQRKTGDLSASLGIPRAVAAEGQQGRSSARGRGRQGWTSSQEGLECQGGRVREGGWPLSLGPAGCPPPSLERSQQPCEGTAAPPMSQVRRQRPGAVRGACTVPQGHTGGALPPNNRPQPVALPAPASSYFRLTAFVLKSFAQARSFIFIDPQEMAAAKGWIVRQQRGDGSFPAVGRILNKDIQVSGPSAPLRHLRPDPPAPCCCRGLSPPARGEARGSSCRVGSTAQSR